MLVFNYYEDELLVFDYNEYEQLIFMHWILV